MANTTLLHQLFPIVRAEVLRLLFTNPGQELYVRELARLAFLSLQTVQDELAKLEAAGLISSRSNGYQRFYRANPKHPLYRTLRKLVIDAASHRKPSGGREGSGKHRRDLIPASVESPSRELIRAALLCSPSPRRCVS